MVSNFEGYIIFQNYIAFTICTYKTYSTLRVRCPNFKISFKIFQCSIAWVDHDLNEAATMRGRLASRAHSFKENLLNVFGGNSGSQQQPLNQDSSASFNSSNSNTSNTLVEDSRYSKLLFTKKLFDFCLYMLWNATNCCKFNHKHFR